MSFNNKSKLKTFMQSSEGPSNGQSVGQLLNASDPDDFLMEKYSALLQEDREEFEFCKQYLYHFELKNKIALMESEIEQLHELIQMGAVMTTPKKPSSHQQKSVKQEQNSQSNQNTNRLKRMRRTANQISRHFQCPVDSCKKEYGSEGSLNQHIKLKHEYLIKGYENGSMGEKGEQKVHE